MLKLSDMKVAFCVTVTKLSALLLNWRRRRRVKGRVRRGRRGGRGGCINSLIQSVRSKKPVPPRFSPDLQIIAGEEELSWRPRSQKKQSLGFCCFGVLSPDARLAGAESDLIQFGCCVQVLPVRQGSVGFSPVTVNMNAPPSVGLSSIFFCRFLLRIFSSVHLILSLIFPHSPIDFVFFCQLNSCNPKMNPSGLPSFCESFNSALLFLCNFAIF